MDSRPFNPLRARLLSEEDFCQGDRTSNGQRCLLEWSMKMDIREACPLFAQVREAIKEASGLPDRSQVAVVYFNDNNPPDVLARVFNRALYLAGFQAGNPESQPLPVLA